MKRVLIVEDEAKLARLIARVLREEGYAAEAVYDGRSGLARASAEPFDLVILDWMLPDRSGIQIVRGLRAAEVGVPVLMLTARGQVEDRVEGHDAGADDYIPKPFAFAELLARVRALTRRPHKAVPESVLRVGDLTLDPVRHVVRRGDERIDLTAESSRFSLCCSSDLGRCSRARCCSTPCGEGRATPTRTSSTSTSPTCGKSWTATAGRPTYAPCEA